MQMEVTGNSMIHFGVNLHTGTYSCFFPMEWFYLIIPGILSSRIGFFLQVLEMQGRKK